MGLKLFVKALLNLLSMNQFLLKVVNASVVRKVLVEFYITHSVVLQ